MRPSSPVPATSTRRDVVARGPLPLQPGAERPAPGVQQEHVEDDEEGEDRLAVLPARRDLGLVAVVDADVEGRAEGEGGADEDAEEDREELVDPAAAAA